MKHYSVIIVGAGASGLFTAANLPLPAEASGLILESTARPGTKLRLAGGGHCNFTHAGSIKDFPACYGDHGRKIRSILYKYSNLDFIDFLESNGVPVTVSEDGRYFPASMESSDILDLLLSLSAKNKFSIRTDSRVCRIEHLAKDLAGERPVGDRDVSAAARHKDDEGHSNGYRLTLEDDASITADYIVIATGGLSYPGTGSNGSMLRILECDLGIQITSPAPSLGPIHVQDYPYRDLAGLSIPNATITVTASGRKNQVERGGLLFTHSEFSGPAALNLSGRCPVGSAIHICYVDPTVLNGDSPADSNGLPLEKHVEERIQAAFASSRADAANILSSEFELPKRFCQEIVTRTGGRTGTRDGLSPKRVAKALTNDAFTVDALPDWNKSMVTRGGIDLVEVKLKTMELKEWPGLFAVGEVLDVDGATGGYNLQFAYSSARACAEAVLATL